MWMAVRTKNIVNLVVMNVVIYFVRFIGMNKCLYVNVNIEIH